MSLATITVRIAALFGEDPSDEQAKFVMILLRLLEGSKSPESRVSGVLTFPSSLVFVVVSTVFEMVGFIIATTLTPPSDLT